MGSACRVRATMTGVGGSEGGGCGVWRVWGLRGRCWCGMGGWHAVAEGVVLSEWGGFRRRKDIWDKANGIRVLSEDAALAGLLSERSKCGMLGREVYPMQVGGAAE